MNPSTDERITSFLAWRRRRALEAGLLRPEQLLDEWVFRRILISAPKDIYSLENLRLLTAPLFHQYGDDLLALCQSRPVEDERPRSSRREEPEERSVPVTRGKVPDRPRRTETVYTRAGVRADSPTVSVASGGQTDRKSIADFSPAPEHADWAHKPFEFGCSTLAFKFWETDFLETWGALLDSISAGSTPPLSDDERALASLVDRSRKASKEWEQAWVKVILRRAYDSTR
ncbi:MAG TPA: DUF413 domain-containing protein [Fibrobacteria bacterium]|nr:DUF413 domain-containing protein [Fibrobacteria bacterium]